MAQVPIVAQMHPDFEWDLAKYWIGRFVEGGKNPLFDGRFLLTILERAKDTDDSHAIAGTIEDCFGRANFNGLIHQSGIKFIKQYVALDPDPFVTDMTGKARTASPDYEIVYTGNRVDDGHNVLYEGKFEIKDKGYKAEGTFILVSQGASTPLDTTRAKFKASWEAARNIPIYPQ